MPKHSLNWPRRAPSYLQLSLTTWRANEKKPMHNTLKTWFSVVHSLRRHFILPGGSYRRYIT
jgi:hypothetical protein